MNADTLVIYKNTEKTREKNGFYLKKKRIFAYFWQLQGSGLTIRKKVAKMVFSLSVFVHFTAFFRKNSIFYL